MTDLGNLSHPILAGLTTEPRDDAPAPPPSVAVLNGRALDDEERAIVEAAVAADRARGASLVAVRRRPG